jgi:ArsR family transcriptional regulator
VAENPLERLTALHKALSDETRIRVVNLLLELGELCVCDIEAGLDITQSKASRHLAVLKQAGLLDLRREGTWTYYGIHEDLNESTSALLAGVRSTFGASAEGKADIARTKKLRRSC